MIPVMRAERNPAYKRIVVACGSQMGKTDSLLANLIGYRLDDDPVPALYLGPTRSFVESVFEPRVMAMLRSADSLWRKTLTGKAMTRTKKMVGGVPLRLAWAGSATELAGDAVGLALCDERDRMPDNVGNEGDPGELLETRVATYPDGKVIYTSTPTIGNLDVQTDPETGFDHWTDAEDCGSPIWRLWQEGTRHEWAWPCPECGGYFIPRFRLLSWPDGSTPGQARRKARLGCPCCGALLEDTAKTWMNRHGLYIAPGQWVEDGEAKGTPRADTDTVSFWVSGLASPWVTWGERAQQYVAAARAGDQNRIQVALNTAFGELFRIAGEAPDWRVVADKREPYRIGEVPNGVQMVTAGVDVQKDRLYYVVRGWGYRSESWLLEHGELWGETEKDTVWSDLGALLERRFGERRIAAMLVDSGYRPGRDSFRRPQNKVYEFCRRYQGWAIAAKGVDSQERPIRKSRIDVNLGGATIRNGLVLLHLDSDHFKSWVHTRIEWPSDEPGAWHIPEDATDDYCQQVVAESRAVKASGAVVWIQNRRDNHYLDCEYLARAAAELNNVDHLKPRGQTREKGQGRRSPEPAAKKQQPRNGGGWMGGPKGWMGRR